MRIMSFNVNGLNSFQKFLANKNIAFNDYMSQILKVDILCVQEVRGNRKSLDKFYSLKNYVAFMSVMVNGYAGVCTFVRKGLNCDWKSDTLVNSQFNGKSVEICGKENGDRCETPVNEFKTSYLKKNSISGLNKLTKDKKKRSFFDEGRILITSHGNFTILNVYCPFLAEETYRSCDPADRDRVQMVMSFYRDIEMYARQTDNLIVCGDINAAYRLSDHYQYSRELIQIKSHMRPFNMINNDHPKATDLPYIFGNEEELEKYFFGCASRRWLHNFINDGLYIDAFAYKNEKPKYTCWNSLFGCRSKNWGTRIDYVLIHKSLKNKITDCKVLDGVLGSDHCPVYVDLEVYTKDVHVNIANKKNNLLNFLK